jgi:hypothetical protein
MTAGTLWQDLTGQDEAIAVVRAAAEAAHATEGSPSAMTH